MERIGQEREDKMRPLAEELVRAANEVEVRCPECERRAQNKKRKERDTAPRKSSGVQSKL